MSDTPKSDLLFIPIELQCVVLNKDQKVMGPEMRFSELPYFDGTNDVNPDKPFLAESATPQNFNDESFTLKKGVHIKWELPGFLRQTKKGAKISTDLPSVPNRWIITRTGPNNSVKKWLIYSDKFLTVETVQKGVAAKKEDRKAVEKIEAALGVEFPRNKELWDIKPTPMVPYAYLGTRVEIKNRIPQDASNAAPLADYKDWETEFGKPLTSMGWGTPSFDTYYPNSWSSFGFHDEFTDTSVFPNENEIKKYSYEIKGYYSKKEIDYWRNYIDTISKDLKEISTKLTALTHLGDDQKEKHALAQINAIVAKDLKITLAKEGDDIDASIQTIILSADSTKGYELVKNPVGVLESLRALVLGGNKALSEANDTALSVTNYALGHTPLEALSAMLIQTAKTIDTGDSKKNVIPGNGKELEEQLQAVLLADELKSQTMDIGPKFKEFIHRDNFIGVSGGSIWEIQIEEMEAVYTPSGDPDKAQEKVRLSPTFYEPLNDLNEKQRAYDKGLEDLESLKMSLYTDWYRYMHCAYPPEDDTEEFLPVSEVKFMIEQGSLAALNKHKAKLKVLEDQLSSDKETIEELIKAYNTFLKSSGDINEKAITLKYTNHEKPAQKYWQVHNPVLVCAVQKTFNSPAERLKDERTSEELNAQRIEQEKIKNKIGVAEQNTDSIDQELLSDIHEANDPKKKAAFDIILQNLNTKTNEIKEKYNTGKQAKANDRDDAIKAAKDVYKPEILRTTKEGSNSAANLTYIVAKTAAEKEKNTGIDNAKTKHDDIKKRIKDALIPAKSAVKQKSNYSIESIKQVRNGLELAISNKFDLLIDEILEKENAALDKNKKETLQGLSENLHEILKKNNATDSAIKVKEEKLESLLENEPSERNNDSERIKKLRFNLDFSKNFQTRIKKGYNESIERVKLGKDPRPEHYDESTIELVRRPYNYEIIVKTEEKSAAIDKIPKRLNLTQAEIDQEVKADQALIENINQNSLNDIEKEREAAFALVEKKYKKRLTEIEREKEVTLQIINKTYNESLVNGEQNMQEKIDTANLNYEKALVELEKHKLRTMKITNTTAQKEIDKIEQTH